MGRDTFKGCIWRSDLQLFLICQFSICEHHPELATQAEPLKGLTAERGFWKSPPWERCLHWLTRILGSVVVPIALAQPEFMRESFLWNCMFLLKKKFSCTFFLCKKNANRGKFKFRHTVSYTAAKRSSICKHFHEAACQFAFIGLFGFHYNSLIFPIGGWQDRELGEVK